MSQRVRIGALLAFALLLRLASNRWLTAVPPVLHDDALWYHASAVSMAKGLGYLHIFSQKPTAAWPPGYPALLALLYRLFGADPSHAFLLNALAGTLTCWLSGRIALAVSSPRAQLVTTALTAIAPSHVLFASLVMSESVSTTMLMGLVLAAVGLLQREDADAIGIHWLVWGFAAGVASLVRAESVVLLAVPVLVLAARRTRPRVVVAVAALATLGLVGGQLPWLVRNANLFGRVVPVSTSFGRTFLIGHNPEATGGMNLYSPDPAADRRDLASGDPALELAVDERLRHAGIEFMKEHPVRELELVGARLREMFRGDRAWGEWYRPGPGSSVTSSDVETLGRVSNAFYWLLVLVAAPAFAQSLSRPDGPRFVLCVVLASWTGFFVLVLYGSQRFHFPLLPLIVVLASDTLSRLRKNPGPTEGSS